MRRVGGIVIVQGQKLGSEAGTNGQGHEYGVARPESTSNGSSLSLTQRGWAPMVEPRLETKSVEDPERLKETNGSFCQRRGAE